MSALEELKKKIADIETQSLAMDGCRPTFTVSDIMDLIDSVEHAQNLHNACADGDYISRQAAIGAVEESRRLNHHQDGKEACAHEYEHRHFLKILRSLPSAQPEPCGDMISREYLKEHIEACWINGRPRHAPELNELLSWIDDVPSAQTEIIHCRDCKHWREGDAYSYCQKLFNCGVLDVYDYMRAEDDFCSLAERWEG